MISPRMRVLKHGFAIRGRHWLCVVVHLKHHVFVYVLILAERNDFIRCAEPV